MSEATEARRRRRWPRILAGALVAMLAIALLVAAAGRWSLRRAQRDFDGRATETIGGWRARHGPREADERAIAIAELAAGLHEPRPGDAAPAVRGTGGQAWFLLMYRVDDATRATDATPLPAAGGLRAWLDAREPELDEIVRLLADGVPGWRVRDDEGRPAGERPRQPASSLLNVLVARALDDAARGRSERADRDLVAAWSLVESWRALPFPRAPDRDGLLAALRVVEPAPAPWLARLDAVHPRDELHELITASAVSLPALAEARWPGDRTAWFPDAWVPAKLPFVRALRQHGAARATRTLGELDAALAALPPGADPLQLAPLLPDAWIADEVPLGLAYGVDRRMLVRARAAEVDLALTRRVLELRSGDARPLGSAPLVEARGGDSVTVAWDGVVPRGMEGWEAWFPGPFTVRPAGRPPRPGP